MATNPGNGPDETERTEPGNAGGSNPASNAVPGYGDGEQAETDAPAFDDIDLPENERDDTTEEGPG